MLSKYNIFLEDYKILFNTLTGYIIKLNDNELEKLKRGIVPEELKDIIEEGFSATFDEFIQTFKKNVLEPTLVLTYRCNFDCVYCFQKAFRDNSSVSDKVVNGFIKYIRNHENGRKVRVTFFGGEPLLEMQRIKEISMKLSDLKYSFSVVTNGSLLTKHIVNELKSLGLSHVQVTLDGPREVHDKRRYFVGGRGSYDIILKNLRDIQDDVNIVLRVNIDVNNITSFRELLRDLKQNGITKVRLDPHLVHENVFRNEYWDYILPKDKEGEILVKVWEIAKEEGFGIPQDVFRLGLCVVHFDEDIVVDPGGRVYPCWAFTGNPLYVKGYLTENGEVIFYNKKLSGQHVLNLWKKCTDCQYMPLCLGGCRFFSVLNGKGFDGIDCRKKVYEDLMKLLKYFI
ncbi:radical SAM/SPASM domain-containing protein [Sulfolobus sp. SCGC AB-777_L09]|nr:radical SAM/SPASM domain-containing protein [Sulfolobus sp. SCGC AB-777_L09]